MLNLKEKFDPSAKIFTFLADQELTTQDIEFIETELSEFIKIWNSHGQPVKAHFEVVKSYFIVIGVDQKVTDPSGCSIDSLTQQIKEIGNTINKDFFNNANIAVLDKDDQIGIVNFKTLKQAIAEGKITCDTKIFNAISHGSDLEYNWLIEAGNSWIKRYFNNTEVLNK